MDFERGYMADQIVGDPNWAEITAPGTTAVEDFKGQECHNPNQHQPRPINQCSADGGNRIDDLKDRVSAESRQTQK